MRKARPAHDAQAGRSGGRLGIIRLGIRRAGAATMRECARAGASSRAPRLVA